MKDHNQQYADQNDKEERPGFGRAEPDHFRGNENRFSRRYHQSDPYGLPCIGSIHRIRRIRIPCGHPLKEPYLHHRDGERRRHDPGQQPPVQLDPVGREFDPDTFRHR